MEGVMTDTLQGAQTSFVIPVVRGGAQQGGSRSYPWVWRWAKAGTLLRATYLNLSQSQVWPRHIAPLVCFAAAGTVCVWHMDPRGWVVLPSPTAQLPRFVGRSHISERIHEVPKAVSQGSSSLCAHPQIFSWDRLLQACIPLSPHKIQITERRWLLLQRALFVAQWLCEVAG